LIAGGKMMKKFLCVALVGSLMCAVGVNAQTTVTLELKSDTTDAYYIEATITGGDASEGLALWGADVQMTGGVPSQMACPGAMSSFEVNDGLNNPAGYGGTYDTVDTLLQVGGAQNTINNPGPTPPYPVGAVVTGIGATTITVATGTCDNATDTMDLLNCFANVIIGGETGPVYAVSAADVTCVGTAVPCFGGLAAATVLNADSVGTSCDIDLTTGGGGTTGAVSEMRTAGCDAVTFGFDVAPGNGTPSVEQTTTATYPTWSAYVPTNMNCNVVSTDLVCTFDPLPDQATYRFTLGPAEGISSITNTVLARALVGDVNSDGTTDGSDRSLVHGNWATSACEPDINEDGTVDGSDRSLVHGNWANAAP
jgi:hypothetical protein